MIWSVSRIKYFLPATFVWFDVDEIDQTVFTVVFNNITFFKIKMTVPRTVKFDE